MIVLIKKQTVNENINSIEEKIKILSDRAYSGKVTPINPKQKINDEDLIALFSAIQNKWYNVEVLQEILDGHVTVNTDNPKRTPIGSNYLRRLTKLTGKKWRQKRALDVEGKFIVKIYTERK